VKRVTWATESIERLSHGETVQVRPRGHSMRGKVNDGQLCTIAPVNAGTEIKIGDVVLCRVRGQDYLHLVHNRRGQEYQIGNNHGRINGWITRSSIFGLLIEVGA
jgi:hypothetical protein